MRKALSLEPNSRLWIGDNYAEYHSWRLLVGRAGFIGSKLYIAEANK